MSTFKRTKVVMLPTKEKVTDILRTKNGLEYNPFFKTHKKDDYLYLYFLSDDEIKEGDWVYFNDDNNTKEIYQVQIIEVNGYLSTSGDYFTKNGSELIIATTDKSLGLQEPSQGFIQKFVKKGGIDEVMVEYESFAGERTLRIQKDPETIYDGSLLDERVKVSSDNTITIRPVKDSWSREEVIQLIRKYEKDTYGIDAELDFEWIKENLQ